MPAKGVTLRNGCKINLYLRVGPRRPDGYHDISSLVLPLAEPHDEIWVSTLDGAPGRIAVSFYSADSKADAPRDVVAEAATAAARETTRGVVSVHGIDPDRNTLSKAYSLFAEASGFAPPLAVRVSKGIPHGAGLGGGSANAAALLLHLRQMARQAGAAPLPESELTALAARVGADVPFFLTNKPSHVGGIGEKLTPCAQPFPGRHVVLVCPAVAVSTAWAFNALDGLRARSAVKACCPSGGGHEAAIQDTPDGAARDLVPLEQNNAPDLLTSGSPRASKSLAQAQDLTNDFEDLVFAHFPELARLHGILSAGGPELARMSGTGASLFAVYSEKRIAEKAAKRLANENASVYTQRLPAG